MANPKAWMGWSSGKDSAWALHVARQQGQLEVTGLLTTVTEPYDRVSMHGVRLELIEAQAEAVGLPLRRVPIPAPCSDEQYDAVMNEAVTEAKAQGVTHMIFGDLYLESVRAYREERLKPAGIEPVFPLWGLDTANLAQEVIRAGVRAYVTCLDPRKISRDLAGHAYDQDFLDALPEGADPCAENGEFHTVVCAGPMFSHPIEVEIGETVEREGFVFTDVSPVRG